MNRSIHLDVRAVAAAAFAAACCLSGSAWAEDDAAPKKSDMDAAVQSTLLSGDPISNAYDDAQKWKKDNGVPIEIGAWHWWHANRQHERDFGYGMDGLRGTYFWYVKADPSMDIGDGDRAGVHMDVRFRDSEDDRFRSFYESNLWLWEAYVWAGSNEGTTVKLGKVWRRFGLDWDGSFWGNVAYFDGWKLDPDWGMSVEANWARRDNFNAPTFIQAFVADDHVNGSAAGADAESADGTWERGSVNVRTVPTWKFCEGVFLAVGVSGHIGHLVNRGEDGADDEETERAGALDATWTYGDLKIFGEFMRSNGVRNPTNYVTGGPSDHSRIWELGGQYQMGPITFRSAVSKGDYDNPGGQQILYLLGVTLAVTKNVDVYVEYVRWDGRMSSQSPHANFEDGFSFVLNWRF